MFWYKKQAQPEISVACCLSENSYSLAVIEQNKRVLFHQHRVFNEQTMTELPHTLAKDIDHLNLIGHDCALILLPDQYQLILMDALHIPEAEMAKGLRWTLKGLSDYDLDDVAIDTCLVPSNETDEQQKTFVAITPLSALSKKKALFESVFLNITTITIAEMALKNILSFVNLHQAPPEDAPIMVINICDNLRKLHIVYHNMFYLIRELTPGKTTDQNEPVELVNMHFEIERSIDYCVNQLNLPSPRQLFFTPGFYHVTPFLKTIGEALSLQVEIIDLNQYLNIEPPLSLEQQHHLFYSITGALRSYV